MLPHKINFLQNNFEERSKEASLWSVCEPFLFPLALVPRCGFPLWFPVVVSIRGLPLWGPCGGLLLSAPFSGLPLRSPFVPPFVVFLCSVLFHSGFLISLCDRPLWSSVVVSFCGFHLCPTDVVSLSDFPLWSPFVTSLRGLAGDHTGPPQRETTKGEHKARLQRETTT